MPRFNSCNILRQDEKSSDLWRFGLSGKNPKKLGHVEGDPSETLPKHHFVKGWDTLWSQTINIGWLPMEQVFLRVVRIPRCETPEEMRSMVEFQLEKLSPIPVGQCVWSVEPVPDKTKVPDQMQSVVLIVAARSLVEACLSNLEKRGFEADRLETPFVHQLLSASGEKDGVWFFPYVSGDHVCCLMAWWEHRALQNISSICLGEESQWEEEIGRELVRLRWAGEVEGWGGNDDPDLHLVADTQDQHVWEPLLEKLGDKSINVVPLLDRNELASKSVERLAQDDSFANLVPDEQLVQYRQRLTDRLWMRGLGAVIVCYMLLVAVYFGWLQWLEMEKKNFTAQADVLEVNFKESQELDARISVQTQQIGLRYAALDGWLAISETIPEGVVLNSFRFSKGEEFDFTGTVALDSVEKVTDFNQAISEYEFGGKRLFTSVDSPTITQAGSRDGNTMSWKFSARLSEEDGE